MEKRGLASARQVAYRTFHHPTFGDQLFSDRGDGAALQAGMPGQFSAGDGLVFANQVQDDSPIDIASRFARGDLKIIKIYLAHTLFSPRTLCRIIASMSILNEPAKVLTTDGHG